MSFNLLDAAKGLFTNELVGKASAFLGESESGVTKALGGILPSVIGGLIDKTSSNDGANIVANLASEQNNAGILGNLGSFFSNDSGNLLNKGAGLLSGLFGDKTNRLVSLISNFAGVKSSTSSSLLSMAAPMVLGLLGKHAASSNMGASGIASLLSSQKSSIVSALPAGLNLGSMFSGFTNKAESTVSHAKASYAVNEVEEKAGGALKFLLPILLLAALGAGVWYFTKDGCGKKGDGTITTGVDSLKDKTGEVVTNIKNTVTAGIGKLDSLTGDFMYDAGEEVTIDLPNSGGKLTVGKNSTEYRLINFLNDKEAPIDTVKGNWFEFTNVHFKTGSSDITQESMVQLKNMVTIANSYPAAQFKFGGYTDNTGDAAKNVILSQKRAESVIAMVKKLGAGASSIAGAKGYGPEWPLADNTTAEGRAQNRRVAVNVKAK